MRRIAAVSVNHSTSPYMELMLRSLVATHRPLRELGLALTILDNASEDDTAPLRAYAASVGVPVRPSGFDTHTTHNSHGEVLRRFVLDHPDATHYLFLDTDAVFSQPDAIATMAAELDAAPADVFAIGARMATTAEPDRDTVVQPERIANLYERRLHPFCALYRNTPHFRRAAALLGFSEAVYRWADGDQVLDTCELLGLAMRAFGYRWLRSSAPVIHFFAVSYQHRSDPHGPHGQDRLDALAQHRDTLLAALRANPG